MRGSPFSGCVDEVAIWLLALGVTERKERRRPVVQSRYTVVDKVVARQAGRRKTCPLPGIACTKSSSSSEILSFTRDWFAPRSVIDCSFISRKVIGIG